jgi:excisionase family DNA binding protein
MEPEYLTPKEVAEKLRFHERTVRRLLAEGTLPGVRIGKKAWRVSVAALTAYVEGGGGVGKAEKELKPTREEILKGIGWEPLKVPGVPPEALEEENRRLQDDVVAFVQGLSAHLDKVDAAAGKGRKKPQRKRTKSAPSRRAPSRGPRSGS